MSFHEGPKCLDEGPKCLLQKGPKCPKGAEVVGAEVSKILTTHMCEGYIKDIIMCAYLNLLYAL